MDESIEHMKTLTFVGILALAGCTTAPQTTTQTRPTPVPLRNSYTADQLAKTGRQTTGGALEEVDPEISVQNGHN